MITLLVLEVNVAPTACIAMSFNSVASHARPLTMHTFYLLIVVENVLRVRAKE